MKKKARCPITKTEPIKRGLHLSLDRLRTLGVDELSRIAAGCDTTTDATLRRTFRC